MMNKRFFLGLKMILATHLRVDIMAFNNDNLYDIAISLPPVKKTFNFLNVNYTIDFVKNKNWFFWNLHFFLIVVINVLILLFAFILKDYSIISPLFLFSFCSILLIVSTLLIHYKLRSTIRKHLLEEKHIIIKRICD